MANNDRELDWNAVIARCLAYLCLKQSTVADGQLLAQDSFLERLGLPPNDRAGILGTSRDSLGVMARRAKKKAKRGGTKNGKAKNTKRRRTTK